MGTFFRNILKIAFYTSTLPLMMLVVLTMLDVGARHLFNSAISSAFEISQLLLSMLISLSLGYTTYIKDNFAVTFVKEKLPANVQRILDMVVCFTASAVCFILTMQASRQAIYSTKGAEFTGALEVPVYPTKWVFVFGFLLTALVLMTQFLGHLRRGQDDAIEAKDQIL